MRMEVAVSTTMITICPYELLCTSASAEGQTSSLQAAENRAGQNISLPPLTEHCDARRLAETRMMPTRERMESGEPCDHASLIRSGRIRHFTLHGEDSALHFSFHIESCDLCMLCNKKTLLEVSQHYARHPKTFM
jgi:hypothetical protein